jgi:hypothetical protein
MNRENFMIMSISSSEAAQSIDRATFEALHAAPAPWEIGKPQGGFVAIADRITNPDLDAGRRHGRTHPVSLRARRSGLTSLPDERSSVSPTRHTLPPVGRIIGRSITRLFDGVLRASVGSTEASKSLAARVGVVGPTRAVEARTDKLARPEDAGQSAQPRISDTHGFVTEERESPRAVGETRLAEIPDGRKHSPGRPVAT